jgi:hypothetical protein
MAARHIVNTAAKCNPKSAAPPKPAADTARAPQSSAWEVPILRRDGVRKEEKMLQAAPGGSVFGPLDSPAAAWRM